MKRSRIIGNDPKKRVNIASFFDSRKKRCTCKFKISVLSKRNQNGAQRSSRVKANTFLTRAKSAALKKRSFFPIWLAAENLSRNRLDRWASFWLRFESSNILNLQEQRFLRESKTGLKIEKKCSLWITDISVKGFFCTNGILLGELPPLLII